MNNIEKLAIKHKVLEPFEPIEMGVMDDDIGILRYQEKLQKLEAFAKALQSSEPVAWRIKHEDDDEWDISCDKPITVGNYEVQPLFTIPPSTVPLEEHNKRIAELEADIDTYVPIANQQATEIMQLQETNKTLLDALRYYADKNNWSRDSQELGMEVRYYNVMYGDMYEHNDVTKYGGMRAKQAIAEAEGKEG